MKEESSDWKVFQDQQFCPRGGSERDDWIHTRSCPQGHAWVHCEANEAEIAGPVMLKSPLIKTEKVKGQMKPGAKV